MLSMVAIGVVVLLIVLAIVIATRPDTFRVERSIVVNAPADLVFPYVNDFHQWTQWSPFENLDPNLKRTYTGAPAGVGAEYGWSGNNKAGEGSMVIKESVPAQRIALDLRFTRPFKQTNLTEFTFKPTSEGVQVKWAMSGKNNVMGKAMSLVMNMDKFLGREFNKGLGNLKTVSESQAGRTASLP